MTAAAAVVAFFRVCLTDLSANANLGALPLPAGADFRVRAICTVLTDRFLLLSYSCGDDDEDGDDDGQV